jgi:hypothetical protein
LAATAALTAVAAPDATPADAHESVPSGFCPTWEEGCHSSAPDPRGGPEASWLSVGCGGQTSGGQVRAVQTLMWASGAYGVPINNYKNQIDGQYGAKTSAAINAFEWREGIAGHNGCADFNTYVKIRAHTRRVAWRLIAEGQYAVAMVYRDESVPLFFPGHQPQRVRMVRDASYAFDHGCWWFEDVRSGGWRTVSPAGLDDRFCWSHEDGNQHSSAGPRFPANWQF